MLCEKCGKNHATTHIRSVINGVVTERNLCGYCAASEGYGTLADNSLTQMLTSIFGDTLALNSGAATVRCPCCGTTFSRIAETGRVGCPECYKTFNNELLPYLKRVHGSTKHAGKSLGRAQLTVAEAPDSIESLRARMSQLVAEEKFEEAAAVRDKIKKLEEGTK